MMRYQCNNTNFDHPHLIVLYIIDTNWLINGQRILLVSSTRGHDRYQVSSIQWSCHYISKNTKTMWYFGLPKRIFLQHFHQLLSSFLCFAACTIILLQPFKMAACELWLHGNVVRYHAVSCLLRNVELQFHFANGTFVMKYISYKLWKHSNPTCWANPWDRYYRTVRYINMNRLFTQSIEPHLLVTAYCSEVIWEIVGHRRSLNFHE